MFEVKGEGPGGRVVATPLTNEEKNTGESLEARDQ